MYQIIEHKYNVVSSTNEVLYESEIFAMCEKYLSIHIQNYVEREVPMRYVISVVMQNFNQHEIAVIDDDYNSFRCSIERELQHIKNMPEYYKEKYVVKYTEGLKHYREDNCTTFEEIDYLFAQFGEIQYCKLPIFLTTANFEHISHSSYDVLNYMWFEYELSKCWCIVKC